MKKHLSASILAVTLAGTLAVGAGAATVAQRVTAEVRPDITVQVDGKTQTLLDKNGDRVYPITYDGTTYLPVRALGGAVGLEVEWNSRTQTVSFYTGSATRPEDLTLEKLTQRTSDVESTVSALRPASDYAGRKDQYDLHSATIDTLRDDLYTFAQKTNQEYRDGTLSSTDYNTLTTKTDRLDNRLKDALDDLRRKTIDDETGKLTVAEGHQREISALETRLRALEQDVKALKSASTSAKRLEQYKQYAQELSLLSRDIGTEYRSLNTDLRDDRLTNREYSALYADLDALDDRLDTAWDDLTDKTVDYDDRNDGQTGSSTGTAYQDYLDQIAALDKRADKLVQEAESYSPAQGSANNKQAWRALERKIDELDDELDDLEDAIERDYRAGKLTAADFRALDKELDRVDHKIDDLDDRYDDDWDDDHDDHDDWDD